MGSLALLLCAGALLGQGFPSKESAVGRLFSEAKAFKEGPDAAQRARQLKEQVMEWEPESDSAQEITFWGMAAIGSFGKSLRFEWTDLESRRAGLHQWLEVLGKKAFLTSGGFFCLPVCRDLLALLR